LGEGSTGVSKVFFLLEERFAGLVPGLGGCDLCGGWVLVRYGVVGRVVEGLYKGGRVVGRW
jgi:hypothetical protein